MLVAFLDRGGVGDLLAQAATRKLECGLATLAAQRVGVGQTRARFVAGLDSAPTVNGGTVDIKAMGGNVTVDGARVTKADINASNGVINVIDKVLMP